MAKYAILLVLLCAFQCRRAQVIRFNVVEDIYLRFYTGTTVMENVDIKLFRSAELFLQPKFNKLGQTVIYIHGFLDGTDTENVKTVASAYLEARPWTNVIVVDWSNMALPPYFLNAAPNTKKVARAIASEIKRLLDGGLDLSLLHIVGHSLGGQIAGFTGRELQKVGIKLKRVTALDPAFPDFYPGLILSHIDSTDAEFVDIIHTDAGAAGAPVPTGTVDFWPNGGALIQPGCPVVGNVVQMVACSHLRSWWYWAESVRNPLAFPAVPANSYSQFQMLYTKPGMSPIVYMGLFADPRSSGNYYLMTNDRWPFGRGIFGTYYIRV